MTENNNVIEFVNKTIVIDEMTCAACESKIERKVSMLDGVSNAKASYSSGLLKVTFNDSVVTIKEISEVVEKLGYIVVGVKNDSKSKMPANLNSKGNGPKNNDNFSGLQIIQIGIVLLALFLLIQRTVGFNFIPTVDQNTSFAMLFVIGLITSLHCVAMCGGINLSQSISKHPNLSNESKFTKLLPSLMYNGGRVVAYTVVGGVVGALGSVVSLSGTGSALVSIIAGVFMVIMGLNLMNVFPWLRKFNPRMPKFFANKIHSEKRGRGPFVVGLLNGLMPCGPLQAMQIYALSTGSFFAGAMSMFLFSIGTVPLMFAFGAVSSMLTAKFTKRMMTVSAFLVIILGVVMLNRGLGQTGFAFGDLIPGGAKYENAATINGNVQEVTTTLESGSYDQITVQKGIPVKWTIKADASNINGCNNVFLIPEYNKEVKLQPGDNVVEFTPDKSGTFPYSCWMGMINSKIIVVDDLSKASKSLSGSIGDSNNTSQVSSQTATKPTEPVYGVATIANDKQSFEIDIDSSGYNPNVIIVQKGIETEFNFNIKANSCAIAVVFPQYQDVVDLSQNPEITFTPDKSFQFTCSMSMFGATVIVVDKLDEATIQQVKDEINANPSLYVFQSSGGGCACCGN
ncbi:MAG: heavy metal transporter [Bacillales bacterium]|jgi:sulfite exporter TauE/SafE/plastocyanin domain-containing protein/copper chaperone CopZ|nr:heavy metal transporter [Bacillales bacterium]